MRFYQEWKGFIWEFNSFGQFLRVVVARILGAIVGIAVLVYLFLVFIGFILSI